MSTAYILPSQCRYASIHSLPSGLSDGSGRSTIEITCRSRPRVQMARIRSSLPRSILPTVTVAPRTFRFEGKGEVLFDHREPACGPLRFAVGVDRRFFDHLR